MTGGLSHRLRGKSVGGTVRIPVDWKSPMRVCALLRPPITERTDCRRWASANARGACRRSGALTRVAVLAAKVRAS